MPGSVLFECLGAFAGVAAPVCEVNVIEVVTTAAVEGGEVFDGASLRVKWREVCRYFLAAADCIH